jgi:hypothetical protein
MDGSATGSLHEAKTMPEAELDAWSSVAIGGHFGRYSERVRGVLGWNRIAILACESHHDFLTRATKRRSAKRRHCF